MEKKVKEKVKPKQLTEKRVREIAREEILKDKRQWAMNQGSNQ